MTDNCTDTSNEQYLMYWYNYFVSIGYIDSSNIVNIYAPYGKCTRSSLWITYLINVVHFFILSSGVLYLLSLYRNHTGLSWPFITWISSFLFLIAACVLFALLNVNITLFTILIIAFQVAAVIILSISLFAVIYAIFPFESRHQRCLFFFIIILFLMQFASSTAQIIITLHCLYNLKFISLTLDYSYLSAIIAAIGTIVSTLLLDLMFMWFLVKERSFRVAPAASTRSSRIQTRATSPVDPVVLNAFHQRSGTYLYHVYSNTDQTRHFHILPKNSRVSSNEGSTESISNAMRLKEIGIIRRDT